MKVKCPRCLNNFELDVELHEEGDSVECTSCGIELFVARKGKKLTVVETFEEEDEEIQEL
ncbi:MAG: hypothetical protein ABH986_03965 [archaeon]